MNKDEDIKYFAYIWITYKNGLIDSTKFCKEIDLSKVKIGDKIENFYNEVFPIFNVVDNYLTLTNDGVKFIVFEEKKGKVHKLLSEMVSSMQNVDIPDLQIENRHENISAYNKVKNVLKDIGIDVQNSTEAFSLEKYMDARNQLWYEVSFLDNHIALPMKSLICAFDGYLYRNEFIKNEDGVVLAQNGENDDSDRKYVNYSDISKKIDIFETYKMNIKNIDTMILSKNEASFKRLKI